MAGPVAFLSPDPTQSTQFIPGGNTPASGAQLFVYAPGTTQKISTFTDPSASTARTNPIVLDSGGNIPGNGEVWITSTAKFVLAPSNDADPPQSPYWTRDNYYGINNITAAQVQSLSAQSEWVQGSTATFVGVTAFSVVGDQTLIYTLGRRVKATVTGGDRFGIVTSAVLATNTTAVGVTLDSSTLNGGLSSVSYGILSTPNGSVPWEIQTSTGPGILGPITFFSVAYNEAETTVTSSANPNIWTGGNVINFTGTTNVSSFPVAPQAGATRTLLIEGSTSATFSTSSVLSISGGASTYTAAVGERIDVIATSSSFFYLLPTAPISSTWVPTVGGSATYTTQFGTYTKIGRLVFIRGSIAINAIGTGSNNTITGLPFVASPPNNSNVLSVSWVSAATTFVHVGGVINGSQIGLVSATSASASLSGANSVVSSGTTINVSGCYEAI